MALLSPNATNLENKPSLTRVEEKAIQRILRAQWLRAAILGANDGLLSTASIMLGIGAASSDKESMFVTGIAGAFAGACSMAVGEFVSVSTQRDIEKSTIVEDDKLHGEVGDKVTLHVHTTQPTAGESELRAVLVRAAVSTIPSRLQLFADQKSLELKNSPSIQAGKDSPSNHEQRVKVSPLMKSMYESEVSSPGQICAIDHQVKSSPIIGFSPSRSATMKCIASESRLRVLQEDDNKELDTLPNPYKAAAASALSFLCGAFIPIVSTICVSSSRMRFISIMVTTSIALAAFGGLGALLGGSSVRVSAMRVVVGGWISMSISYGLLKAFDALDRDSHERLTI